MKKKTKVVISVIVVCILLVLSVPVPTGAYKDGGTRMYTALTYKVVKWQVLVDADTRYKSTSVYWYPDNFKSYEELWAIENSKVKT